MANLEQTKNINLRINDVSYSGVDIQVWACISSNSLIAYQDNIMEHISDIERQIISMNATNFAVGPNNAMLLDDALMQLYEEHKKYTDILKRISGFAHLSNIQTISYSVYRDKLPVRKLGIANPAGFTRGQITIAGTMIFTVGTAKIMEELTPLVFIDANESNPSFLRIDQLPPIDIFITYENEIGKRSRMGIYGVEFLNEGQVHSVHDLITENSVNYLARHISPMREVTDMKPDQSDRQNITANTQTGAQLTLEDYKMAKKELTDLKKRFL